MEQNIHSGHRDRLRQKAIKNGLESFTEHEVLELMLSFVLPRIDTNPLAHLLINKFGSIKNVINAPVSELIKIDGVGQKTAKFLKCMGKFSLYLNQANIENNAVIKDLETTKRTILPLLEGKVSEEVYLLCVSSNNRLLCVEKLGSGTDSFAHVEIKNFNKIMNEHNCSNFILCHNHPNGDKQPSAIDNQTTKAFCLNSILNNYNFMDHVIIGNDGTFSYFHSGMIDDYKKEFNSYSNLKMFACPKAKYGE